jgi:splicing factor 3B subunit 3
MYQGRFHLTPLSYETLEYASGFASEQCPEGIVAISTNTLRLAILIIKFCKTSILCFL